MIITGEKVDQNTQKVKTESFLFSQGNAQILSTSAFL